MKKTSDSVQLSEKYYIGEGKQRQCYQHPEIPELCVKVTVKATSKRRDQSLRELIYYKLLEKRGVSWDRIAKCYGWIQTNLGRGLVFELIRDKKNQPLPNLEEQLKANNIDKEEVSHELKSLKKWIIRSSIIVADLRPANIVYNPDRPKGKRLILVDGVSNRNLFKLASHIPCMARNKMKRTWKRFCKKHLLLYGIHIE